jgi:alanine racemase
MGIVKADAYGHGAVPVAKLLEKLEADYLAVSNMDEAMQLRRANIKLPILILGYTLVEHTNELINNNITQAVFDYDYGKELAKRVAKNRKLKVHIKIDTGMSRLGFVCGDTNDIAAQIVKTIQLNGLEAEGIFTHFAASDDNSSSFTDLQFKRFMQLVNELKDSYGIEFQLKHCANSAAVLNYPHTQLDMVRPGLALYGLYPALDMKTDVKLLPVMQLKTRVCQIKDLKKGTSVSYGCTYKISSDSRVAILPIGYADGFLRAFSNELEVLVDGAKSRVIGRVCMDMAMINVTKIRNIKKGDLVIIFGNDGKNSIPVEELAKIAKTISYEIVCLVGKRVPRIYISR